MFTTTTKVPVPHLSNLAAAETTGLNVDQFRQTCTEQAAANKADVVVDFSSIAAVDSIFINELIRVHLGLREQGRELCLTNVQPQIANFLRLLRLDRSLKFTEACNQTEQSCQTTAQPPDTGRGVVNYLLESFSRGRARRRILLRGEET